MKVAKAFDVSTGSSNRKGAKFGGGSAVRADWLCIGSEMRSLRYLSLFHSYYIWSREGQLMLNDLMVP